MPERFSDIASPVSQIAVEPYGRLADGTGVERYTLKSNVIEAGIITYGARIESLSTPDRDGVVNDIVLGFDGLAGYARSHEYTGAVVGRYANRIANGVFALDGARYRLPRNAAPNSMHGGGRGFDQRVWRAVVANQSLELTYLSKAGEEGYPGQLATVVRYTVIDNQLKIEYTARTDSVTVLNLTNHSYFNLTGRFDQDVLDHWVTLHGDYYTSITADMIPTGELCTVDNTPFDFRKPSRIGARIGEQVEQLRLADGYDHNWILNPDTRSLARAAEVYEPSSGRTLTVFTSQPGIQFYTGNNLTGLERGKGGIAHRRHCGLCLETQHYPDSPNQPHFPSTTLRPGGLFRSTTVFEFSTRN